MKNTMILKQPANTEGQMWKSALPLGNGIMGALVYGAVSEETVIVTRHDLWQDRRVNKELPDVSGFLEEARALIDKGDYASSNLLLQNKLRNEGYAPSIPTAFPLGALSLKCKFNMGMFKHYRRGIDMEHAEFFTRWNAEGKQFQRTGFISRENGILYIHIKNEAVGRYELTFDLCDHHNGQAKGFLEAIAPSVVKEIKDGVLYFTVQMGEAPYGALITVAINDGGSCVADEAGTGFVITSADYTIKLLSFAKTDEGLEGLAQKLVTSPAYDEALKAHSKLHMSLYNAAEINFAADGDSFYDLSNEELLARAYEDVGDPVLYEKLWKFGRYLFISGTAPDSNPFSLYGIWSGDYNLPWNQNVGNQNVQMIYWHILAGNLAGAMKPLVDYYCRRMASYRENAEKLFGCRGIYVPTYSAPATMSGEDAAPPTPCVSVVLNWISCAGWLSHQFYQYYQYTGDKALLQEKLLPFMVEAARFYADYIVYDQNGKLRIYPSVSPENTPKNFLTDDCAGEDYLPNPVVENATMDFAILKALLRNLLEIKAQGDMTLPVFEEEADNWQRMLSAIPDYLINEDGALKEWIAPNLEENYFHRHFSHIFPLFPGDEIDPMDRESQLYKAAEKAVCLRESNSRSGWAFAHSASIMARLHNGEEALHSLDMMAKSCLFPNLFTSHNDWRHMGVSMYLDKMNAPIQLDALMGSMNALQEMLLQYRAGRIAILPALPSRFAYVQATGLKFPGGEASISLEGNKLTYTVTCERDMALEIILPSKRFTLDCRENKQYIFEEDHIHPQFF